MVQQGSGVVVVVVARKRHFNEVISLGQAARGKRIHLRHHRQ